MDQQADGGRRAAEWINAQGIAVLNVAGPRESKRPGIYRLALHFLDELDRCHEIEPG